MLIAAFVLQSAGFVLLFRQLRAEWKREQYALVKSGRGNLPLTAFEFTAAEYEQYKREGGKEVEYNGNYYDVVYSEKHNDKIKVVAIADTRETELVRSFIRHFDANSTSKAPLKALASLLLNISPSVTEHSEFIHSENYSVFTFPPVSDSDLLTQSPEKLSPPPKQG